MKTGGTLNFLKRAGAIFMLLAIFASSCNKYADDFDQINTKLDALATSVAGVAQLTSDMSALKGQVTALQAAVATLPTKTQTDASFAALTTSLSGITTKVDAITTALGAVATTGNATKAVVDQLKLDLAALATKVTNDDAAMTTQLNGLAADNVTMKANLQTIIAANTALATQITAVQDQITALVDVNGTDATAVTIKGLQLLLNAQQVALDQLLANSNMYNGNVNITSDAEVAFWLPKIGVWKDGGMVNGILNVDATAITSLADLKTITDNILAVIGGLGSTFNVTTGGNVLTFAKLASTTGTVNVVTDAANNEVAFPALVSVGGNYNVTGFDIDDAVLATVTGNVTLDYDGGYVQPALASAANVYLYDYQTAVAPATVHTGTLAVDFSGLTAVTSIETLPVVGPTRGHLAPVAGAANSLEFQSATSIATGAGAKVISVVAPEGLTIALDFAGNTTTNTLASLTVVAAKATSVTAKVAKIAGALAIGAKNTGSSVSLPGLKSVGTTTTINTVSLSAPVVTTLTGAVNLTKTTPVSLPMLASAPAGITAADAVSIVAPVYAITPAAGLTAGNAVTTSIEVASTTGSATSLNSVGALTTLKINALTETFVAPASVKYLTVTGKAFADLVAFTASAQSVTATASNALVTVSLDGFIKAASITSTGLTTLNTAGVVNSLTVNGCTNAALTSLGLAHAHYPSGPGSTLIITNNTKLTSLTTSTNYAKTLTITGNTVLAALNLASYVNPLTVAGAAYTISANALTGGYVASKASQGTDPFVEASIPSNILLPLKSLVAYAVTNTLAVTVALDLDDVDAATGAQSLASKMQANAAQAVLDNAAVAGSNPTVVNAVAAINTTAEMALVVAQ